ncbi:LruC domain-containing protein [Fibrobacterales bacterium]|nr:LruC domain-containing protein [Fibrobacterales bacterium]
MKHLILALFLTFAGQVLASHPADPTGVVIDYALYGKDRLQLYGDAHTPSNGNVGSDNQCMLKNSYKMRIYGELNCGSLRYYGSKWDKATKQIFYEDVNVKGNTYGGYADYEKNMTHGGSLSGASNSGYVIKGIKSNSTPTFLTPSLPTFNSINTTGPNLTVNLPSSTSSINPGNYGNVFVAANYTLNLTANDSGIYHFKSLTLNSSAQLVINKTASQNVRVFVDGRILMESAAKIKTTEVSDYGRVLIYTADSVHLKAFTEINATLVAPFRGVLIDNAVKINGQILAKKINNTNNGLRGTLGLYTPYVAPIVNNAPVAGDATYSISEAGAWSGAHTYDQASDTDAGTTLTYSLSDSTLFGIDQSSGLVSLKGTLDFETTTSYSLTVSASDGSLSSTATITINVTDVDEGPPTNGTTAAGANGTFIYTQFVDENSDSYYYTAPSGYGFEIYSGKDEDYSWKHTFPDYNLDNLNIISAKLIIRGYDVDSEPFHGTQGEYDGISINQTPLNPGFLQGTNNTWSVTVFDLPINPIINTGEFDVDMDIDMIRRGWMTTLDYSKLEITYSIVQNTPPEQPILESNSTSTVQTNDDLVVNVTGPNVPDADGESVEYSYRWFVDVGQGHAVDDEFAGKIDHQTNTVSSSQTESGEIWTVEVTAEDENQAISQKTSLTFPVIGSDMDQDGIDDALDEFPNDSERAATSYYPSENVYNTLVYEDLWPQMGDFDMNDAVISFNFKSILNAQNLVKELEFNVKARARGASFANAFAISLEGISDANVESIKMVIGNDTSDISAEAGHDGELVFPIIQNLSALLPSNSNHKFYGTKNNDSRGSKLISVRLILKSPVFLNSFESAPYNPFIYRTNNRGLEVHLKGSAATDLADVNLFNTLDDNTDQNTKWYQAKQGHPFAMEVPGIWKYPLEKTSISDAYPELAEWVTSLGQKKNTWYQNRNSLKTKE